MWIATLSVVAALAPGAEPSFLLRRTFPSSSAETYTLSSETKTTVELPGGIGEQSYTVTLRGSLSYRNVGTDIYGAKIDVTSRMEPMKATGPMAAMTAAMAKPAVNRAYGTMDILNRMKFPRLTAPVPGLSFELDDVAAASYALVFPTFPAELVTLGSTWKIKLPPSSLSDSKSPSFVNYTLSARDSLNGIAALVILSSGDMSLSIKQKLPPNTGIPGGAAEMEMKMTSKLQGKIWIDATTGRTLRAELGGTAKSKISMGRTMTIDTTGEQKTVYIAKL